MNVLFLHIRDHDHDGNLMAEGGATLAYHIQRTADSLTVEYAAAECAGCGAYGEVGDRFRKSIGRDIASKRLKEHNIMGTVILGAHQEDDIEAMLYTDYISQKQAHDPDAPKYYYPHRCSFDLLEVNPEAVVKVEEGIINGS